MPTQKSKPVTPIETTVHKDRRTNIPTEELRDFVAEDENKPKTMLYPRDPSLDPQLVWKGKDEQDSQDLAIPAVPIYIQEKIHPKYLIEELRAQAKGDKPAQLELFADFNGLQFEELVEFYQHDQNWSNRMILGDSLLVMTSLAEKEGLKGKVQMIYIDPPYGINFGSNWQVSTRKRDVKDGKAEDAIRQPEQIKAFRDTWKLGIHSYLAYLRDRLVTARDLLTEAGSIFVQIGDENVHLVRCLMDEVFGSDNFIAEIAFQKTGGFSPRFISQVCDYLLWYAKDKAVTKSHSLFKNRKTGETDAGETDSFQSVSLESGGWSESGSRPLTFSGNKYTPRSNAHWKTTHEGLSRLAISERIMVQGNTLRYKMLFSDFPVLPLNNIWADLMGATAMTYVVQTNTKVIERCLLMTTDPGDLVLDPTCGSGTTAYVAEEWGRRWLTIDTSRVALALARTRFMSARFPYYLLADSPEGIKKESEITGRIPPEYKTEGDIRKGFVYNLHFPYQTGDIGRH